ncbi:MAG: VWA domain-containing protein [Flavobacteriaceae bacterium]
MNPTIKNSEIQNTKPILSVLLDNSESIAYFKDDEVVNHILEDFKNDKSLNNKFDVSYFSFDRDFKILDTLNYLGNQTNISKAINSVNAIYKDKIAPIVLISDGNQTLGNDYEFSNTANEIYSIVIGDTVRYKDLKISQLNVNKYSYLKNKFPVESILYYQGEEPVTSVFTISRKGKRVFSKKVSFSSSRRTATIETSLPSLATGKNYYTATIQRVSGEKNTSNNTKTFSVEVIDEQTKVVLLTSILHPDIGAFKKAIETNKQRVVEVKIIGKENYNLNDYQLAILYQPNRTFDDTFKTIKENKTNYIVVTGTKTDWNYLNSLALGFSKNAINKSENYIADYNKNFLVFGQEDIDFNQFPPLEDKFGESFFTKPYEPMLFQNINGIPLNFPLLATLEEDDQKSTILLGEGIWKWRASSYLSQNSFEDFDNFIDNLIQYVASTKIRRRLDVEIDAIFPANVSINISALYLDNNYRFDSRASITMEIINEDKTIKRELPFSVIGNSYQLSIEDLPPGNYSYKVKVKTQNVSTAGTFKVTAYKVEEQFTRANKEKLDRLAERTGGKLYHKSQVEELVTSLLNNPTYYTTQKTIIKDKNIIDWIWVLAIVLVVLTIEWFIRKYYGKI